MNYCCWSFLLIFLSAPVARAGCNRGSLDQMQHEWTNVVTLKEFNEADYACAIASAFTAGATLVACEFLGRIVMDYLADLAGIYGPVDETDIMEKIRIGSSFRVGQHEAVLKILTYQCTAKQCCFTCNICEWESTMPNRHAVVVGFRNLSPRKVYVRNSCGRDIQVAARYMDDETRQWYSKCWYQFSAYEGAYLMANGARMEARYGTGKYIYAESIDGELVWEGTDSDARTRTCSGRSLSMMYRTYVESDGDLYTRFTCWSRRRMEVMDEGEEWEAILPSNTEANTNATLKSFLRAGTPRKARVQVGEYLEQENAFKHTHMKEKLPDCEEWN